MSETKKYFPLMIDLSSRKIIVIGSGKVALRKARYLSGYANVQMIASSFSEAFEQLQHTNSIELTVANLQQLTDSAIAAFVKDAFIVIPATNDSNFNQKVTSIAQDMGVLVNQVDAVGEVLIPSVVNQGALSIGISTQGKSPALSRYTRLQLESIITKEYADMARLQEEMRGYYKLHIEDQQKRKKLLWEILNNETIWLALADSYDRAITLAKGIK